MATPIITLNNLSIVINNRKIDDLNFRANLHKVKIKKKIPKAIV